MLLGLLTQHHKWASSLHLYKSSTIESEVKMKEVVATKKNSMAVRQSTGRKGSPKCSKDLEEEVKMLRQQVKKRDAYIKKLSGDLIIAKDTKKIFQGELEKAKLENQNLLARMTDCYASKEVLANKLATADRSIREIMADINCLKSEADEKDDKMSELTRQLVTSETYKKGYEDLLQIQLTEVDEIKKQHEHERQLNHEEMTSLKKSKEVLANNLEEALAQMKVLTREADEKDAKIGELTSQLVGELTAEKYKKEFEDRLRIQLEGVNKIIKEQDHERQLNCGDIKSLLSTLSTMRGICTKALKRNRGIGMDATQDSSAAKRKHLKREAEEPISDPKTDKLTKVQNVDIKVEQSSIKSEEEDDVFDINAPI